jgi:hypothetical protein
MTTLYLQPNFTWPRGRWTITPLITVNHMTAQLGGLRLTTERRRRG